MLIRRVLFLAVVLAAPTAFAQTPQAADETVSASLPLFEVISVRQDKTARGWRDGMTADGYSATGITLYHVIMGAYGNGHVSGTPSWGDNIRYDVEAKIATSDMPAFGKLDRRTRYKMLQQILAERFKLQVHYEDILQPIYVLTVAKNGPLIPKFQPSDDALAAKSGGFHETRGSRGRLTMLGARVSDFAGQIWGAVGRDVVDRTGLTDRYNFDLKWSPDDGSATATNEEGKPDTAPSIFTAVQEQLGLKLDAAKGPVNSSSSTTLSCRRRISAGSKRCDLRG